MLLPDEKGKLVEPPEVYTADAFGMDAAARFPDLAPELEANSIHQQMHTLAEAVRAAIKAKELPLVGDLLNFVAAAVERPEAETEIANAVQISFLLPEDFSGTEREKAWAMVPTPLVPLICEAV